MTKLGPKKWTPSWTAGALGTFAFVIAAIFLIRIYIVHVYREHSGVVSEEAQRVGVLVDRELQSLMTEVNEWREKHPLKAGMQRWTEGPPVAGARAFRIYEGEKGRLEWVAAGFGNPRMGIEGIAVRDKETRLVVTGPDTLALAWTAPDATRNYLVFDKTSLASLFAVENPTWKERVAMLLLNSMDQMLLQSNKNVGTESFRGQLQYQYDGRGIVQIQDLGRDVLAFLSIPSAKGLVLVARVRRER